MTPRQTVPAGRRQQHGLTMISWIIVIAFVGFQVVLALNVVPVYINDRSVKSVMETVEIDNEFRSANSKKIKALILKKLKINSVYGLKADNITLKKEKNGIRVTLEYEPRGTLVGNLEYIVKFRHEAVIPK